MDTAMEFLRSIRINLDLLNPTSIVDILIVAVVLYYLMILIRGTRAVQLIKGIVVLILATAISSFFQLHTVHWILKSATTALTVALPIVFYPELRRGLEKLGGGDFFGRSLTQMAEDDRTALIDEVSRAVVSMSATRTGALVVLERNSGLGEFMETGVKLDALVSEELLVNIFMPKSPLHDGAAIIRGNRIQAAACVLPLSDCRDLSRELGTRHRAAVGLTEQTDALVLVVSEETGNISLAKEGNLYRRLNETGLHELLVQFIKSGSDKKVTMASLWPWR